jgi:FtsZ-binding cell division protein ZapB
MLRGDIKMTNTEKLLRINHEILDTERLIEKATKKYNDTIICLKMEIAENKEFGNDISANRLWVNYALQDKARLNQLRAHLQKLLNMSKECVVN